ncbi:MAG TPA: YncE family protein [Opitutaceae bacterium]|jgi:DNA-binding beta-propeller fold protein YncE|nr:YncE family protein [Opitutaceae bacterium]
MKSLLKNSSLLLAFLCASATALADYHVLTQYKIGGEGGYDYIRVDSAARRLYVSHATRVEVLDADTGKKLGEIAPTNGVHGIAVATEFNHGFTSNGKDNAVTMFDLKTLQTLKVIPLNGKKPDAIVYDADTKQVFVCNGGILAVIDAATGELKTDVKVGGSLEELVFDGSGRLFVNAEDQSVIHVVDTHALKLIATWPIAPGEGPTGLAIDRAHHRLFSACGNGKFVVLDSDTGAIVTTLPISEDPDGATFEPATGRAFASTKGGTLTVVQEESPDKFSVLQNVTTLPGARTLSLDEKTGEIFLPTAKFGPVPTDGSSRRAPILPGTFMVLVVGQ